MNKIPGTKVEYDLVVSNGKIISFEPNGFNENFNIGIINGKIRIITERPLKGKVNINAQNHIVAPGFIDFHSHVSGKLFSAECIVRQGATTTIGGERNFDGKLIRNIAENGFLINHGFYVSHSFTLRRAVGRYDIYSPATNEEIEDMKTLATQFFQNGSFGIHFGLEYVPGTSEKELVELSKIAKKFNRVVLIHMRGDGVNALNHFEEVRRVMEITGVSIHLLHLAYMTGYKGVMPRALEMIRNMRGEGFDITADTGIYAAYPNCIGSSILKGDWTTRYACDFSVEKVLISSGIHTGEFCTEKKFEYLRENFPSTLVTVFACDEEEIIRAIKEPYVLISSNAADGPHYENVGHPETAGTFPKLIGRFVRDQKILSLHEAIKKISYEPAERFHVFNKGNIKIGFDADIVIFDYDKIIDRAEYVNFGDPNAAPDGIDYVIVNGSIVKDRINLYKDKLPGKLIKHNI